MHSFVIYINNYNVPPHGVNILVHTHTPTAPVLLHPRTQGYIILLYRHVHACKTFLLKDIQSKSDN